jgi:hypothetical protein
MPDSPSRVMSVLLGAAVLASASRLAAHGETPNIPKISAFAPAADLVAQVDYFVARLEASLASEADFDLAAQSRSLKDANTLSALLLVLAVHDQPHVLSNSAPAMLAAAQQLAGGLDGYSQARQAFDALRAARQGTARPGMPPAWAKVASLSALMKQVPLIHLALKRGVEPNRFARQTSQSAAQSAALAAVAQAAWLDTTHVSGDAETSAWRSCCEQMRDAAGEVNLAVHAGDAARVSEGMQRLSDSCDACHARFRRP